MHRRIEKSRDGDRLLIPYAHFDHHWPAIGSGQRDISLRVCGQGNGGSLVRLLWRCRLLFLRRRYRGIDVGTVQGAGDDQLVHVISLEPEAVGV